MPKVVIEINDTYAAIVRPVALNIIEDIKRITGIDPKCKTIALGATSRNAQPDTLIGEGSTDVTSSDMLVQFEIEEDPMDESTLTNSLFNRDKQPIFLDSVLDVLIKPVYTQTEYTLNIKGRFPDRNSAVKWRNSFRRSTMSGRRTNTHSVTYHYPIPLELLILLIEIHRLRERKAPYGETLETYIRNHIGINVTTLADQAGNNQTVAVSESQVNVTGYFDIAAQPDVAEVDKDKGTWEVSFNYRYRFDKPISCIMEYPLVVHNQLLNKKFRPNETAYSIDKELVHPALLTQAADYFRNTYPGVKRGLPGISMPFFDDWYPKLYSKFYTHMFRILIRAVETDANAVLTLTDLQDYELDPLLINYLNTRPTGLVNEFDAAVHLRFYEKETMLEEPSLLANNLLEIRSVNPLKMRAMYHVVLEMLMDLTMLSPAATAHLRTHGEFFLKLAGQLYPNVDLTDIELLPDGSVKRSDYIRVVNDGKEYYYDHYAIGVETVWLLPGFFTIIGKRNN